ncbi:MAG: DUF418 domain-containing protein [bacterium]|nr:DUF418 domain-containing protein [bacterium]
MSSTNNRVFSPIAVSERLQIIDVLRGFAILGILLINIQEYSFPHDFDGIYLKMFSGLADQVTYWGTMFFFKGKFVTMLSILLGLGMAVQVTRAIEKGKEKKFSAFFARRMLMLLIIGIIHDLVVWHGIILPIYGAMGFFLLFFKKRKSKTLITWAIIFIIVPILVVGVYFGLTRPSPPPPPAPQTSSQTSAQAGTPQVEKIAKQSKEEPAKEKQEKAKKQMEKREKARQEKCDGDIATYRDGNYFDMTLHRFGVLKKTGFLIVYAGWGTLALFLLGIWGWRRGILQDIEGNLKFLKRVLWFSLPVGVVFTAGFFLMRFLFKIPPTPAVVSLGRLAYTIGEIGMCLFFVSGIVFLYRKGKWPRLWSSLAAVGRMAFSNYVFQSVVCTFIFYSYGLKLFGKTGPLVNFLLVIVVFAIQIPLSVWWGRHFRFGPVEWLWRSLTYGKRQPMRLKKEK